MYTTITNQATIEYQSKSHKQKYTVTTAPCTTLTSIPTLSLDIICNKDFVEVGEEFMYTYIFHNPSDFTLTSFVCLTKLNPVLTYIENSLTYNGILLEQLEFVESIELPDIQPSHSGVLQFRVYAHELPVPALILNSYSIEYLFSEVMEPDLQISEINVIRKEVMYSDLVETRLGVCMLHLEQSPDKEILTQNSQVHMNGTIQNTGTICILEGFATLKLPDGTHCIPDSLYVNGTKTELTENNTFSIGTLEPDSIINYSYDLQVDYELPEGDLTATAIVQGNNSVERSYHHVIYSNKVVNYFVVKPPFQPVILEKLANSSQIGCGETITYTLIIENPNDSPITNLFLKDTLPFGLCYIPCSMTINKTRAQHFYYPNHILLPDLGAKERHIVTFDVMLYRFPCTWFIQNFFSLDYNSPVSPVHHTDFSNTHVLKINYNPVPCEDSVPSNCACPNDNLLLLLLFLCGGKPPT